MLYDDADTVAFFIWLVMKVNFTELFKCLLTQLFVVVDPFDV
jgi:hypothetical protein